jgi:hypothetical protein
MVRAISVSLSNASRNSGDSLRLPGAVTNGAMMLQSRSQFEEFVLPHLSRGRRGPPPTLSLHKIFNYILPAVRQRWNIRHLVARGEDDTQRWPQLHGYFNEFDTRHARNREIGGQYVERK